MPSAKRVTQPWIFQDFLRASAGLSSKLWARVETLKQIPKPLPEQTLGRARNHGTATLQLLKGSASSLLQVRAGAWVGRTAGENS